MALSLGSAGSLSYGLAVASADALQHDHLAGFLVPDGGAAGTAEPSKRGATLAVHSMLGYAGGFVGPLAVGWTLDAAGGASPLAWGLAFALIAALMGVALAVFWWLQPRELVGDKR